MVTSRGPEAISPTAHYTGYVWTRNGLAPRALATTTGKVFYYAAQPAMLVNRKLGLPTFESLLLARHRILDGLLTKAIEDGRIGQVIEIAAGLSGRGWRFTRHFGDTLTYVEADLPAMAARKRKLLASAGELPAGLRIAEADALHDDGPLGFAALTDSLDPHIGTAIITEGLLNYFPLDQVSGMMRRFAKALGHFPHGMYLSDLHLEPATDVTALRVGAGLVGALVRGQLYFHFTDRDEALGAVLETGFTRASVRPATSFDEIRFDDAGARTVNIVQAETGNSTP